MTTPKPSQSWLSLHYSRHISQLAQALFETIRHPENRNQEEWGKEKEKLGQGSGVRGVRGRERPVRVPHKSGVTIMWGAYPRSAVAKQFAAATRLREWTETRSVESKSKSSHDAYLIVHRRNCLI